MKKMILISFTFVALLLLTNIETSDASWCSWGYRAYQTGKKNDWNIVLCNCDPMVCKDFSGDCGVEPE